MSSVGGGEAAPDGDFRCVRCRETGRDPVPSPPFPNELGDRIRSSICSVCWEDWKQRQMLLINHYGLRVREAEARAFLISNMRSFLFGEGDEPAEIDGSREGDVRW